MKAIRLTVIALFLFTVVNVVNRFKFWQSIKHLPRKERRKRLMEYDRQEAMALDGFAGRNYRHLWNQYFKTEEGYKFGVEGEMISSALGKNEHDETLSKKGAGRLSKWLYGESIVKILDKLDKEHCKKAIDLTKGDWQPRTQKQQ